MANTVIRKATLDDGKRLLEIYNYYVLETAVTFEITPPTQEEFRNRMEKTLLSYPFIVIEEDKKAVGYAYAGPFVGREAYKRSAEVTIYLDKDCRRKGYGGRLYRELEALLKNMGVTNLYACIGDPIVEDEYLTKNSERFHEKMGYKKVGTFSRCGEKFGRIYNMIWMEKFI